MENTYSSEYMQAFIQAYEFGLNPAFIDVEDMLSVAPFTNTAGHISGFMEGRKQYELLNGPVYNGIPRNILTEKILEQYMIDGIIGLSFDELGYTRHQLQHISRYYEAGKSKRNYKYSFILEHSLNQMGIAIG
ncbi:MAG TPA: hypothetical protein VGB50_10400 [Flavobacterium sp.]|jgi:hypothetical protein